MVRRDLHIFPLRSPSCQCLQGRPIPLRSHLPDRMRGGWQHANRPSVSCSVQPAVRLRQNRIESHQRICVFSVAFLEGLFVRLNFSKSGDQGEEDTAERWGVSCSSSLCWGSRTRAGGKQGPQLPGLTVLYATKFLATALGQGKRTASG